jgi:regulator of cell morphogenesis and NO signaling
MSATLLAGSRANGDVSIGQLVTSNPRLAGVFEKWGLDYCCGGHHSLTAACNARGVDEATVRGEIAAVTNHAPHDATDWRQASLAALIDDIVSQHHSFLRRQLPYLLHLAAKVSKAHGSSHGELIEIETLVSRLANELSTHMQREEHVLFPLIQCLEAGVIARDGVDVAMAIARMEEEHGAAGEALLAMRNLSHNFAVPVDGCPTYRVFYRALEELERDLHMHVHKENNILFPRALQQFAQAVH